MNPCVVTFETNPSHPGLALLVQSCHRWGWPIRLVHSEWRGWGWRLKRVLAQADRLRQEGFTHLFHLDARDVLMVGPVSRFADVMAHYGNPPLLFATEHCCWPGLAKDQWEDHHKYQESKRISRWSYTHSQFILDLTQPVPVGFGDCPDNEDDQYHAHRTYLADLEGKVRIDNECRLVQSIAFSSPWEGFFELDEPNPQGRLINRLTGSRPLAAHANGGTHMHWLHPEHPLRPS
jgi:hypothetical protein